MNTTDDGHAERQTIIFLSQTIDQLVTLAEHMATYDNQTARDKFVETIKRIQDSPSMRLIKAVYLP